MNHNDPNRRTDVLAGDSLKSGDPIGWFEMLYAEAIEGRATIPWDRGTVHPLIAEWTNKNAIDGSGRSAIVVGCGTGDTAEFIAELGFATTAFDVSESGISIANQRFPDSHVDYLVADVFDLPGSWTHGFDLVVEVFTVQALPVTLRTSAFQSVASLTAPGGHLILVAAGKNEVTPFGSGPPWPLVQADIDAFTGTGLESTVIERISVEGDAEFFHWRAEYVRNAG
ncbi:MAG: class I SAM-dependent methyltransferase [Thermomicrobiales bacterium]